MSQSRKKMYLAGICALCLLLAGGFTFLHSYLDYKDKNVNKNTYYTLPEDTSAEDPLLYLGEDFEALDGFHSNMPILILSMEEAPKDYKAFKDSQEHVLETEDTYVKGHISVIDSGNFDNHLSDAPVAESDLRIKMRGHTSYQFDKKQYLIKLEKEDGTDNPVDMLGMGEHHTWILNGSMADKSMIRNYLSYRISSEISDVTPDCQFCEVILNQDGKYVYQGVFLLMESIARSPNRIDIDEFKQKNRYTSYIVRRDRFTNFDVMLDTYGRLNEISPEWIGVKYPSEGKLTETAKKYIEKDFSKIEKILYSEDDRVFRTYDKYIDVNSFVDYYLINEYFGNYDAGEHSTYMYKNSGERLKIGPVWDFDQAMNNYFLDEMDTETMAFQTAPLFDRLSLDARFIDELKERYSELRKDQLSDEHVFAVIDEAVAYLASAREREWYRWAADYEDGSGENGHNYYLNDYIRDGNRISRFNDNYDQEIYLIKTYLHKHGNAIQTELTKLYDSAEFNSSLKDENELFLVIILTLMAMPSVLILRRG